MSTLTDLIASIHTSLHSYSGAQEQVTWLTADVDAAQITLAVASSDGIMRGLCEIENELVYVISADSDGLQLPPFGRGFRGSVAASHPADAAVIWDPIFPRVEIRRAIDQCIAALYPALYQIKTVDLAADVANIGYSLPADCGGVLSVRTQLSGHPYNYDDVVSRWEFDGNALSGKVLNLFESVVPGSTIRVTYKAPFGTFADETDTLESIGLQEQYADLVLYGVSARLIRFLDPARLQTQAVENLSRASVVQVGDASKIANQLYSLYQQRLAEEQRRLLELSSPSIHFTR